MEQKIGWVNKVGWWAVPAIALFPAVVYLLQQPLAEKFPNFWAGAFSLGDIAGLVGMALFSCVIILSARLKFLERFFKGLNQSYVVHHKFGVYAFILLLAHPVLLAIIFLSQSFKSFFIFFLPNSDLAQNMGIAGLLVMATALIITLYLKIKYQVWKFTHKFLGLAYIFALFHIFLIGADVTENNILTIYFTILGTCAVLAYSYRVLFPKLFVKRYNYNIKNIQLFADQTWELEFEPAGKAMKFSAGQFAFLQIISNAVTKEWHPFTMSSSPTENLKFGIKELGDWSKNLGQVKAGDRAKVEGPFGVFNFRKYSHNQIWIAGGIGVTPFLSWMRDFSQNDKDYQIDFYYSAKNDQLFAFKAELEKIAQKFPNIKMHFWSTDKQGFLTAEKIKELNPNALSADIFVCGPAGMMAAFKKQFADLGAKKSQIHTEDFQLY